MRWQVNQTTEHSGFVNSLCISERKFNTCAAFIVFFSFVNTVFLSASEVTRAHKMLDSKGHFSLSLEVRVLMAKFLFPISRANSKVTWFLKKRAFLRAEMQFVSVLTQKCSLSFGSSTPVRIAVLR